MPVQVWCFSVHFFLLCVRFSVVFVDWLVARNLFSNISGVLCLVLIVQIVKFTSNILVGRCAILSLSVMPDTNGMTL
uniref:Uncharacterized protein n=1 Tax=Rhizophora mucronata TaxID=61149 RepID=A0A2P2N1I9_RHIMU